MAALSATILFSPSIIKPPAYAVSGGDSHPPDIELLKLANNQTVYTEKIYIAGRVIDDNEIKSLRLNNTPILKNPGRSTSFSHLVVLKEGENIITIEATDRAGNSEEQSIAVTREKLQLSDFPPEVIDNRLRLAIYPFEANGAVTDESTLMLDLLTLSLQSEDRFQLVDRNSMDRILEEQKLSLTRLIDRNSAVKLGKLMSAQAIITGSIKTTNNGIEIVSRVIDTETAGILVTEKVYTSATGFNGLNFLAEAISVLLHNDFPMLSGFIIKKNKSQVYTDLGKGKVSPHGRLIIYRSNEAKLESDSAKGRVLGYARVTEVLSDMSKTELFIGNADEIRVLDRVVFQ